MKHLFHGFLGNSQSCPSILGETQENSQWPLALGLRQLFPRAFPHTLAQWFDCSPRSYDIILYWGTSWQGENKPIAHLTSKDDSGNAKKLTINSNLWNVLHKSYVCKESNIVFSIIYLNILVIALDNLKFPALLTRGFPKFFRALNFWHINMHSVYRGLGRLTAFSKPDLCCLRSLRWVGSTVHARGYTSDSGQIYDDAFSRSVNNPAEFWAAASEDIVWHKKWTKVLDDSNSPFTQW